MSRGLPPPLAGDWPGGKPQTVYRAITQAITPVVDREAITDHESNHVPSKTAGQAITEPIMPITHGSNHVSTPPYKGVERVPSDGLRVQVHSRSPYSPGRTLALEFTQEVPQ